MACSCEWDCEHGGKSSEDSILLHLSGANAVSNHLLKRRGANASSPKGGDLNLSTMPWRVVSGTQCADDTSMF